MNFKVLPLSILTISVVAGTALSSQAQLPKDQNNLGIQVNSPAMKVAQMPFGGEQAFSDLDLTEEQKTKIQTVRDKYRPQMDAILTSEQKNQLKAEIETGKKREDVIKSLGLSSEQQGKMQELMKSQRGEISSILTLQQKQKLMQKRWQR